MAEQINQTDALLEDAELIKDIARGSIDNHFETANRVPGTTYTNNTGKPMTIGFAAYSAGGDGNIYIRAEVNGSIVTMAENSDNMWTPITFVVPKGGSYKISDHHDNFHDTRWVESY